jgi:Zn-dependent peptidase ImmA (M78 family)
MYSLFHELGHLLTRTSSACLDAGLKHSQSDHLERWCEAFAAALLLPWDEVKRVMTTRLGWREGQKVTDLMSVTAIARRFKTSLRATTLRLIEHGVASWNLYGQIPAVADFKAGGGGGEGRRRPQIMLDEYGERTADLFIRAMSKDIIDRKTVLDHLDIPDSDLDRLATSRQTA